MKKEQLSDIIYVYYTQLWVQRELPDLGQMRQGLARVARPFSYICIL